MVRHKSYSQTDGERALAAFMVGQHARDRPRGGADAGRGRRASTRSARWSGTGGGKSLLFNGHLDTNPVTEGWTVDPWGGMVDDKFIYGIGVSNMKAGDAAYFCAVKTLIDAGVRLKGDVILTYVVGELQGGVGTLAAIRQGVRADYFINTEPTDLQALTMHAAAFTFIIELTGITRHLSKREEAVDAIAAACDLIPRLNAHDLLRRQERRAPLDQPRAMSAWCTVRSARELHEWRPPQVADFVRLKGSGRYAPGQTEEQVVADMRRVLADLEAPLSRPQGDDHARAPDGRPMMPAFEVAKDARIVKAVNAAYEARARQPAADRRHHATRLLRHRCRPFLPASSAWRASSAAPAGATTPCRTSASTSPTIST